MMIGIAATADIHYLTIEMVLPARKRHSPSSSEGRERSNNRPSCLAVVLENPAI